MIPTTLNPVAAINVLLGDYAPAKVRRIVHSVILLVAFAVTIWQGADGDWKKAVVAGLAAIYAAANQANTQPHLHDAGHDSPDDEDDLSYEEAGGQDFPTDDEPAADPSPAVPQQIVTPVSASAPVAAEPAAPAEPERPAPPAGYHYDSEGNLLPD